MSLTHVLKRPVRYVRYYGNRPRRALRRTSRYFTALADPQNYPRGKVVRAYWFDQFPNFGDALTPWLLQEAGYIPQLSRSDEADVSGVGSILEMLPLQYDGAVWGSGLLYGQARPMPRAQWLAVRGQATRELVGAPAETPLGDPGILVSRFIRRTAGSDLLGLVPHHAHLDRPLWQEIRRLEPQSQIIDPVGRPQRVVSRIAGSSLIITSSLHGLITADAFGIPAVWVVFEGGDALRGGEFKFHDYESAYEDLPSRRVTAVSGDHVLKRAHDLAVSPPAREVTTMQRDLMDALRAAGHRSISPLRSF